MIQRCALVLLCLSATQQGCGPFVVAESGNLRALGTTTNSIGHQDNYYYSASHQHRDLGVTGWWYTLLNLLHAPCPHGHSDEKPLGHCAHSSHHHSSHKTSGGGGSHSSSSSSSGGSSSSSSGCTDGSGCTETTSWGGDGHTDDTTASWGDDGHTDEAVAWSDDGHTDAAVEWSDDGHTNATDAWSSDGYSGASTSQLNKASSSVNYKTQGQNKGGSSNGKWAAGAVGIGLVGAAYVATRKRKQRDDDVPQDVYIGADDDVSKFSKISKPRIERDPSVAAGTDEDDVQEFECDGSAGDPSVMQQSVSAPSVRSSSSRAATLKSALSRGGATIRSKLALTRNRSFAKNVASNDGGDYQAPNAVVAEEPKFGNEDGGIVI